MKKYFCPETLYEKIVNNTILCGSNEDQPASDLEGGGNTGSGFQAPKVKTV